ncbi:MAG: UxaA family hydrolase [Synergistaceae bacterium]|nr:UxaA family hydrolase [Synergistaceae bacterium]
MENAVIIRSNDSVVTVTQAVKKGDEVRYPGCKKTIIALQDTPIYHKIAISETQEGKPVFKYGEQIGFASSNIRPGEHVHTHNLKSVRA